MPRANISGCQRSCWCNFTLATLMNVWTCFLRNKTRVCTSSQKGSPSEITLTNVSKGKL